MKSRMFNHLTATPSEDSNTDLDGILALTPKLLSNTLLCLHRFCDQFCQPYASPIRKAHSLVSFCLSQLGSIELTRTYSTRKRRNVKQTSGIWYHLRCQISSSVEDSSLTLPQFKIKPYNNYCLFLSKFSIMFKILILVSNFNNRQSKWMHSHITQIILGFLWCF